MASDTKTESIDSLIKLFNRPLSVVVVIVTLNFSGDFATFSRGVSPKLDDLQQTQKDLLCRLVRLETIITSGSTMTLSEPKKGENLGSSQRTRRYSRRLGDSLDSVADRNEPNDADVLFSASYSPNLYDREVD